MMHGQKNIKFQLCEGTPRSMLSDSLLVSKAFLQMYTSVPSLMNEQLRMH